MKIKEKGVLQPEVVVGHRGRCNKLVKKQNIAKKSKT